MNQNNKRGPEDNPKSLSYKPLEDSFWHNNVIFICLFLFASLLATVLVLKEQYELAIGVFSTFVGSVSSFYMGKKTSKR